MAIKKFVISVFILVGTRAVLAQELNPEARTIRLEATRFENGSGVTQDYSQAYRLYCKAALLGDKYAASSLGWMYLNQRGVGPNLGRAVGWLKRAADQGDFFAAKMLTNYQNVKAEPDPDCRNERKAMPLKRRETSAGPGRRMVEDWVKRIAPKYAIDPELVIAVIEVESGFNPSALSGKNAQGLMQLIPETAERFGIKDVWNPIENIKGGTAYLHWLLRHFEGNVEWALAAYNAGENTVEKYKGVPPYEETQKYVQNILSGYQKTQHPIPPELLKKNEIDREILRLAAILHPIQ